MKQTAIALVIAAVLVIGSFMFIGKNGQNAQTAAEAVPGNNVSVVDGVQIIDIGARGGYTPKKSVAKAGLPTVLRFNTNGTFDCSSSVRIPSKGISKVLPQSGATDIDVGVATAGTLQGSCGMGMYPFEVEFTSS